MKEMGKRREKDGQGRKGSQFNRPKDQTSTNHLTGANSSENFLMNSKELRVRSLPAAAAVGEREVEALLGFLGLFLLLLPLLFFALLPLPLLNLPLQQIHLSQLRSSLSLSQADLVLVEGRRRKSGKERDEGVKVYSKYSACECRDG
jgi:hypothetical protein